MRNQVQAILVASSLLLGAGSVLGAETTEVVTGEVLDVGTETVAGQTGALDRITIRTRSRETQRLLLGQAGSCPACYRVGDRVRARVMTGDPATGPRRVRTMEVRRTGESLTFRDGAGNAIRTRVRTRDGSCIGADGAQPQRQRDRAARGTGAGGKRR
jgi:hypothetical protein